MYIGDIMHNLNEAAPSMFEYLTLEKWLNSPDNMIRTIYRRIENGDFSGYNERICSYIANGLEE